jgi:hypothetical protein
LSKTPQFSRIWKGDYGPAFIFKIDEITENPDAFYNEDFLRSWRPSVDRGANVDFTAGVGVSGKHWLCDGDEIFEISSRPNDAQLYKTYSVYYIGGVGFSILRGDARRPPDDDGWHPLQFMYYNNEDYSSYLTNAGQAQTLRLQPQDHSWANLVLPTINHTHTQSNNVQYGGLTGELPIFLALLAFTTSREYLPNVLPRLFAKGKWVSGHKWQMDSMFKVSYIVHDR